jgi:uncharacterized ion transporter superfamily protein YfcC
MEKEKAVPKKEATPKKRRVLSSFTIMMLLTIVMAALTWFVPAGRYDTKTISTAAGEKEVVEKNLKDENGEDILDEEGNVQTSYRTSTERIAEAEAELERVKLEQGITDEESEEALENEEYQAALEAVAEAEAIRNPQGLWEVLLAPVKGTKEVVDIIVCVFFVGGLLALEAKVGAIQAGFKVLMRKMKGKEKWLIPTLIALFAVCGSAYGSQEETVVYYTFMVPLMMAAGYNAMTALMTVIIGTTVGIAASTVNPFSAIIASDLGGTEVGQGMVLRAVMLLTGIIIGSIFVVRYAEGVRAGKHAEDSVNDHKLKFAQEKQTSDVFDAKRKATLIIMMMALIVITIFAFIPWDTLNINLFVNMQEWFYNLPIIGRLFGNITPFGWWYFDELSVLYLVAALAIGFMYKIGDQEFVDIFIDGAKDVMGVCLIIGVARGITVVMNDGNITHTILHALETALSSIPTGVVKGLFGGVLYLIYLPMAFLIPSTSGLASISMPIFGPLADILSVGAPIAVASFVAGSGIIQMLAPTVGSLMGGLVSCGVSYNKYLKRVKWLAITLSVAYIVLITIASVTGFGI